METNSVKNYNIYNSILLILPPIKLHLKVVFSIVSFFLKKNN